MSYTPPVGGAADFTWVGVAAYTPPVGGAANFAWVSAPSGASGVGTGTLFLEGAGVAKHGIAGAGTGALVFAGGGEAGVFAVEVKGAGSGTLTYTGAGVSAHGIAGGASGALAFVLDGAAGHGIAATGAGALGFVGTCAALHLRYEVRGEVRMSGVLVNRRVRCSKRSTGELMGQADTLVGHYRVHAGFDEAEVYVTAIDLSDAAADWMPPTANRLVPVLADDAE